MSSLIKKIHKDGEMKGMKSHDYHVMMQEILPLCLWNLMAKNYKMALICLSRIFKKSSSKNYECRNPSLGLTTKARVCKGVDQEGSLGVWESVRLDIHTPK